jgi:hypothetical protein
MRRRGPDRGAAAGPPEVDPRPPTGPSAGRSIVPLASESQSIHIVLNRRVPLSAAPGGHAAPRLSTGARRALGRRGRMVGSRSLSIVLPGPAWGITHRWCRGGILRAGSPAGRSTSAPCLAAHGCVSPGEQPPRRSPPVDQAGRQAAAPPAGPSRPLRPQALTLTAWNGRCWHHCSFSESCSGLICWTDSSGRPRSRTLASRPCRAAWSTMGPVIRVWPGASLLTWRPSNQLDQ